MAETENLIDFEIIETSKENIQPLASGRSAKALAQVFSPVALQSPLSQTQSANDTVRSGFEKELAAIDDCDDPLDVYDRYVKWTLDAYPSAQATPQSRLLPLLERATKALLPNTHYKNDPRYLKIWLHYIRLFSDAPRETFAYLSRHGIGEALALYYEEFAAWLEGAERWKQAEEIYKLGIEREARPTERLVRKFGEFEKRLQSLPEADAAAPSSPALPVVRAALAAKHDPFSVTSPSTSDPQAAARAREASGRAKKGKLEIFSDANDDHARPSSNDSVRGWESIGSLADRKKENVISAKPWQGEGMKGMPTNMGVPKMPIFKDPTQALSQMKQHPDHPYLNQRTVNPRTGKPECVFVNLEAVYPDPSDPSVEYTFEELRAAATGWLEKDWKKIRREQRKRQSASEHTLFDLDVNTTVKKPLHDADGETFERTVLLNDENAENGGTGQKSAKDVARKIRREEKANKTRNIKVKKIKVESQTQTIQANLNSPQKTQRPKRKKDPTMTMISRAATDEVYDLFNQPLKSHNDASSEPESSSEEETESDDDDDDSDDYTSGGESTTGRISAAASDIGDETRRDLDDSTGSTHDDNENEAHTARSNADWTGFTSGGGVHGLDQKEEAVSINDHQEGNQDIEEGSDNDEGDNDDTQLSEAFEEALRRSHDSAPDVEEDVVTPTSPTPAPLSETRFIPVRPEDYNAPTRPYRDAAQVANSRLPFMTPIAEKTESSLGTAATQRDKDYFNAKTPCPNGDPKTPTGFDEGEAWSSPFEQDTKHDIGHEDNKMPEEVQAPVVTQLQASPPPVAKAPIVVPKFQLAASQADAVRKGPIIAEAQCNPMDPSVHQAILAQMQPPISSYEGYFAHHDLESGRKTDLRKHCKLIADTKSKSRDRAASTLPVIPSFRLEGSARSYTVRKELGKGAYAPVYLVEGTDETTDPQHLNATDSTAKPSRLPHAHHRQPLEALKLEDSPPSAWEFYMLSTAHRRLGVSRAAISIVRAHECHVYRDESLLIEEFRDQGTILDVVNFVSEQTSGAMDEALAMFFAVELLRTVEALHAKGLIHGDMKADNILLRFSDDLSSSTDVLAPYHPSGREGWSARGVTLIDFGRGIDMKNFIPGVQFIADWKTSPHDCPEMRDLRPWTYQCDYYGLAGILHTLLYGKYMEPPLCEKTGLGPAGVKTYKLRDPLKRYWCTEVWAPAFELLLNSARHVGGEEGGKMPVLRGLREVREGMEEWLVKHGEKGTGLRAWVRRVEGWAGSRKGR